LLAGFKTLAGVTALDLSGLTDEAIAAPMSVPIPDSRQLLLDRLGALDQRRFFFDRGVQFSEGDEDALSQFALQVQALQADAENASFSISATLVGSTDGIGDAVRNAVVAEQRAAAAQEILTAAGVKAAIAEQSAGMNAVGGPLEDPLQRYVQVNLKLQERPANQ